jgi:hypothetical protein
VEKIFYLTDFENLEFWDSLIAFCTGMAWLALGRSMLRIAIYKKTENVRGVSVLVCAVFAAGGKTG